MLTSFVYTLYTVQKQTMEYHSAVEFTDVEGELVRIVTNPHNVTAEELPRCTKNVRRLNRSFIGLSKI